MLFYTNLLTGTVLLLLLIVGLPMLLLTGLSYLNWRRQKIAPSRLGWLISLVLLLVTILILSLLPFPLMLLSGVLGSGYP